VTESSSRGAGIEPHPVAYAAPLDTWEDSGSKFGALTVRPLNFTSLFSNVCTVSVKVIPHPITSSVLVPMMALADQALASFSRTSSLQAPLVVGMDLDASIS